jgi:hypothetical protein
VASVLLARHGNQRRKHILTGLQGEDRADHWCIVWDWGADSHCLGRARGVCIVEGVTRLACHHHEGDDLSWGNRQISRRDLMLSAGRAILRLGDLQALVRLLEATEVLLPEVQ